MPVSTPATFSPPHFGITIPTTPGLVLTTQGANAAPAFAAGGGGGTLSGYLSAAPSAGTTNDYNPGDLSDVHRLDLDTTAGAVTLTGLVASVTDGQTILIRNTGANDLSFALEDAGSAAANRFSAVASPLTIPAGGSVMAVYYIQTINRWILV